MRNSKTQHTRVTRYENLEIYIILTNLLTAVVWAVVVGN